MYLLFVVWAAVRVLSSEYLLQITIKKGKMDTFYYSKFIELFELFREEWINAIQYVSQKLNGHFVVDISGKAGNKIVKELI